MKWFLFLLIPVQVGSDQTGRISAGDLEAVWVPAGWEGPIVASPFDQAAFEPQAESGEVVP